MGGLKVSKYSLNKPNIIYYYYSRALPNISCDLKPRELKEKSKFPCPICGIGIAVIRGVNQGYSVPTAYQVVCKECCSAGPLCDTQEDALEFWSRFGAL